MTNINVSFQEAPTLEVSFIDEAVEVDVSTTAVTMEVALMAPPGDFISNFNPRLTELEDTAVRTGLVDW